MKRKVQTKKTKERQLIVLPKLKCVWHTRLIIQNTPTGTRYEFQPGETKEVKLKDYNFLLAKKREVKPGCCGDTGSSINYFEEV